MLSVHADHLIPDAEAFGRAANSALAWADETGALATIGIAPTEPATGFGYIQKGDRLEGEGRAAAYRAVRFVEKPPLAQARSMVDSGDYLWNTGLFAWRNRVFLRELEATAPDIARAVAAASEALRAGDMRGFASLYAAVPEMAVDHAVMERTSDLVVVEASFAWSDVGSWADVAAVLPRDRAGNAVIGDAVLLEAGDSVVISASKRLVTLLGVHDLVVVDTPDALLVMPKARAQEVKDVVAELKRQGRDKLL
jgi:mannose-1-phosphate guanylyltransferase/mannose-6-phosphate isomerase